MSESTPKNQPVETIPSLPPGDGHVTSAQLPATFDPKKYGDEGEIGEAFGKILYEIWDELTPSMAEDDAARGRFTQELVAALHDVWPDFNYVIVHTAHTTAFDGAEGKDWGRGHGDFPTFWEGTIGYEVYYCRSGIFVLHGDGGFLNWAWYGSVSSQSNDGRILMFN
ncbi:hypothetical protein NMY22_g13967 [Coprinellus aureogranulatus]|nr:hypothetical protein NMY22_g13967 [Coprinellus aureogranulatus]